MMKRDEAFRVVGKHVYCAERKYEGGHRVIILADSIEEATEKAVKAIGLDSVFVKLVEPTDDPQVYTTPWG